MNGSFRLLVTFALAAVVAASALATDQGSVVVSLQEIDCQSCGQAVVKMLRRENGIRSAVFDQQSAEITVELGDSPLSAKEIIDLIGRAGYRAVEGAGEGRYLPSVEFAEGLDVDWLSRAGEEVDIESGLVPGKVTVVDFYAVWCGPCREVDEEMKRVLAAADDVALRKINVVDWSSPVAGQLLKNVSGLPYVQVYAKSGKKVASIEGLDLPRLRKAIDKARSR